MSDDVILTNNTGAPARIDTTANPARDADLATLRAESANAASRLRAVEAAAKRLLDFWEGGALYVTEGQETNLRASADALRAALAQVETKCDCGGHVDPDGTSYHRPHCASVTKRGANHMTTMRERARAYLRSHFSPGVAPDQAKELSDLAALLEAVERETRAEDIKVLNEHRCAYEAKRDEASLADLTLLAQANQDKVTALNHLESALAPAREGES